MERWYFPDHICELVASLAGIAEAATAIDPCCVDVGLIGACDFVPDRTALFRNPSAMKDARIRYSGIKTELQDFTSLTWESCSELSESCDLVVTCVPFGEKRRSHGHTRRLDLEVAERSLSLLKGGGTAVIIVPTPFLTAPLFRGFRERVLEDFALDAVVEIPGRGLLPNSMITSALLVIRSGKQRERGTLLTRLDPEDAYAIARAIEDGSGDFYVPQERLYPRWDRNYHDPKHQKLESRLDSLETRTFEQLGEIFIGDHRLRQEGSDVGEYLVLSPRHVAAKKIASSDRDVYVDLSSIDDRRRAPVRAGDVLVSLVRPSTYVYRASDPKAVAGPNLAVIRAEDNEYISTYLNTDEGKVLFQAQADRQARGASAMSHISSADLRQIRIPILPLDELNSVSDEAVETAAADELSRLKDDLLRVKQQLEQTEAQLEAAKASPPWLSFMTDRLDKIDAQQRVANEQLESIAKMLSGMQEDVVQIKTGNREDEEKIARIVTRLDEWSSFALSQQRTMDEYVAVVQSWFDHWDKLESLTKHFLPSAEHLYDELESKHAADYSPFVIQYCRALECEILSKLFSAYHADLADRVEDLGLWLAEDLANGDTRGFAGAIKGDRCKYTLGQMNRIMQMIKPGKQKLKKSKLLQEFQQFASRYFGERVVEKEFLDGIKEITDDYRNKASHPYLLDKETAEKCLPLVRIALTEFLENYRQFSPPHDVEGHTSEEADE